MKKPLLVFLLSFLAFIELNAQIKYTIEHIGIDNGLPSSGIKGIQYDDQSGFLWIGTETGIVRYNGSSLYTFSGNINGTNTPVSIGNVLRQTDGSIFCYNENYNCFATQENRLIELKDVKFDLYHNELKFNNTLKLKSKDYPRQALYERVLLNWNKHLYILMSNKIYKISSKDQQSLELLFDPHKKINCFILNNRFLVIDEFNHISELTIKNNKIQLTTKGQLGLNQHLVNDFGLNLFQPFQLQSDSAAYIINSGRLIKLNFNNGKINQEVISDQLSKEEKFNYFSYNKKENVYFLGTENNGMYVLRPKYFYNNTTKIHSFSDRQSTYAQVEIKEGVVQTNDMDVFKSAPNVTDKYYLFKKPVREVFSIISDSILYYCNDSINIYDLKKNKPIYSIFNEYSIENLFVKVNGIVYIVNWQFIGHFTDEFNIIKDYTFSKNNNPQERFFDVIQVDNNSFYIAYTSGVYKYIIDKKNIQPIPFERDEKIKVKAFYPYKKRILITTSKKGLYYIENDQIHKINIGLNTGLKSAHCILKDTLDRLWISTNTGIYFTEHHSFDNIFNSKDYAPIFNYMGTADGMTIAELNSGCKPCGIILKSGNISFPSVKGLVQFNPYLIKSPTINNTIYLDELVLDDTLKVTNLDSLNQLSYSTNKLSFYFALGNLFSNRSQIFQYSVDNSKEWLLFNKSTSLIDLYKPEYGSHQLVIRWIDAKDEKYHYKIIKYTILKPWFKQTWFYSVLLMALIFCIYFVFKLQHKYFKRKLQLRTQISYDIHDTVGTSLTRAIKTSEKLVAINQSKEAFLIAQFCRDASQNFRDAMWSLDENTDKVVNVIDRIAEVAHLSFQETDFEIFVNNKIKNNKNINWSVKTKRGIMLIVREAFNNILKHSNGDTVTINFTESGSKIAININDNGTTTENSKMTYGIGLKSMQNRANKINAALVVDQQVDGYSLKIII